jgi:hypothetical protein
MYKFSLTLFALCGCLEALPQAPTDTTGWKIKGIVSLNLSQTSLSNWQGGGQNNIVLTTLFNFEALYRRDKYEQWINRIDAQYGIMKQEIGAFRKNADQLLALTRYDDLAFGKSWFYAAQADYRTQFAPGYIYASPDSSGGKVVSDFNSPGYLQLALGLDYKPVEYFSLMFAPVALKATFVGRQALADSGAYGVQKAVFDDSGQIVSHGKRSRYEVGARIIMRFKKDILPNINLDSYLDLFSNYAHNPQNIDVIFNNLLSFKINKFFSATILSRIIYDDDIVIKHDFNKDGKFDAAGDINGPRLQALTSIAVGLTAKF